VHLGDRAARHRPPERPSKSETCEIAETQLGLRDSSLLGHSAGYRPFPKLSQRALRTCKEAMSDIWQWPALKLKMAIWSRQRTTISTPNIISDRCAPNRHRRRADASKWALKMNPRPRLSHCGPSLTGLATGMEVGQYPSVGRAAKPKPSGWEWEESDIGARPSPDAESSPLVAAPGAAGTTPKLVA
jgi:hypothetical protein